jgi:TonB family protein
MKHPGRYSVFALSAVVALAAVSWGAQPDAFEEPIPETTVDPIVSPMVYQGGTVVLRVAVGETGSVGDIEVVQPFPALTDPVVTAVRQWRFRPATLNGRAVAASATVAVYVALVRTIAPPGR